jgi:phosphoribosylamine--glycine ligase
MGAFSPVEGIPPRMAERIRLEVFQPTLAEMKRRGAEFSGVLYAGLMWDRSQDRYWVLEFNARFGDPETQVLMPRIQGDVLDWFEAATSRRLEQMPAQVPMARETAVVVVAAAAGYPESPRKGDEVTGLEALAQEEEGPAVFVAGAQRVGSAWQTAGGRVLGIVGMGPSLADARAEAYSRVSKISFSGMHVRRDIGGAR